MPEYNLYITKEELHELAKNGKTIIGDKIKTNCDDCGEDVELEIQLWMKDNKFRIEE